MSLFCYIFSISQYNETKIITQNVERGNLISEKDLEKVGKEKMHANASRKDF